MTQKILVVGGTGFIGRHLVNKLLAKGHDVSVLSRRMPMDQPYNSRITYLSGDFTRAEDFSDILAEMDVVYHLAVTTVPGNSNDQIQYDANSNVIGSLALMDQSARVGVSRFIFVSSGGSVYGQNGIRPIAEVHPTDPISAHGVSKLALEKYLEIFKRKYGMTYRVARASNPYGEGQDPDRGQGFIAYALGRLAQGEEVVIWGDGSTVRDYVYVGDVAGALCLMVDDEGRHAVYNVGSGRGYSLNEMIAILKEITGRETQVRYVAGRPADVPYNCLDITRIQNELNWKPCTDLLLGLSRTWDWVCDYLYEENPVLVQVAGS